MICQYPAHTKLEFTIAVRRVWQVGVIKVKVSEEKYQDVTLRYLVDFSSEVVGQRELVCD